MTSLLLAGLALLVAPAVGHGGLANYTVGDTWYRGCVQPHLWHHTTHLIPLHHPILAQSPSPTTPLPPNSPQLTVNPQLRPQHPGLRTNQPAVAHPTRLGHHRPRLHRHLPLPRLQHPRHPPTLLHPHRRGHKPHRSLLVLASPGRTHDRLARAVQHRRLRGRGCE